MILMMISCKHGESVPISAPCEHDSDCSERAFCFHDKRFPGGLCTFRCLSPDDCGGIGVECLALASEAGVCVLSCEVGSMYCASQLSNRFSCNVALLQDARDAGGTHRWMGTVCTAR